MELPEGTLIHAINNPPDEDLHWIESADEFTRMLETLSPHIVTPCTLGALLVADRSTFRVQLVAPTCAVRRDVAHIDAWDWVDQGSMLLATSLVQYPKVLEQAAGSVRLLRVGDALMQLELTEDPPGARWYATVKGHLTAEIEILVMIGAPSVALRDVLLGALVTLAPAQNR